MMNFLGKTVLVTGATRGIGRAIAHAFSEAEAFVIGTATTEKGALSITEDLKEKGLAGMGITLDIRDEEALKTLMDSLQEQEKMPDILINNAGITRDNLFLRMEDDEWDSVIDTNLSSVFRITRACVKHMFRRRFGRIISIGSVVGMCGNAGQANYCAAKAALIGMSKALAQEVASRGITVNVVSPGFIATDMTANLGEVHQEALLKRIPMKRMGSPEEIAKAVLFLASDGAAYITGETLNVNGGMYMN